MAERKKRKAKPAKPKVEQQVEAKERDDTTGRFLPGNSGFGGRPKGSRNKLGEAFIQDMYEAWQRSGPGVLVKVIADEPATFLRSMVSLMPREMDVNVNLYDTMTDEQLKSQFLAALREARALGFDISAGEPASIH